MPLGKIGQDLAFVRVEAPERSHGPQRLVQPTPNGRRPVSSFRTCAHIQKMCTAPTCRLGRKMSIGHHKKCKGRKERILLVENTSNMDDEIRVRRSKKPGHLTQGANFDTTAPLLPPTTYPDLECKVRTKTPTLIFFAPILEISIARKTNFVNVNLSCAFNSEPPKISKNNSFD